MENWPEWGERYRPGLFVILPPEHVRDMVDEQRRKNDPVSQSRIEAHITVTQPLAGELAKTQWEQIVHTMECCEPFTIQFGPLKSFLPYPCIWYDIQPAEAVLAIREALHQTGLFNLREGYIKDFIPHMTITEGESGPEVSQDLLDKLQVESQSGSFICDELALVAPDSNLFFHTVRTIRLGVN